MNVRILNADVVNDTCIRKLFHKYLIVLLFLVSSLIFRYIYIFCLYKVNPPEIRNTCLR